MEETKSTPEVAAPASAPVDAVAVDTKQSDEPLLSKREIVELRKEMRAVLEAVKSRETPQPKQESKPEPKSDDAAKALSEVNQLRAELAFERAALSHGIADSKQRATLEKLFAVDKPVDAGKWMEETMSTLGIATKKSTEPPPQAPAQSNSGAPATSRPAFVKGQSLNEVDPKVLKQMSNEEVLDYYHAMVSKISRDQNPYKRVR